MNLDRRVVDLGAAHLALRNEVSWWWYGFVTADVAVEVEALDQLARAALALLQELRAHPEFDERVRTGTGDVSRWPMEPHRTPGAVPGTIYPPPPPISTPR